MAYYLNFTKPMYERERFYKTNTISKNGMPKKRLYGCDCSLGHIKFYFFSNFNIGEYFFGAFLCVEQMLENTFSSKTPFSDLNFTFKFTKGLAQKYKGKCVDLVFCILCFKIDRNCWFCSHRSICLLNAVLLIPILLWFMTCYVM